MEMSLNHSGFAKINGTDVYYEIKGEGHPLVLVHGFPLDSRMWDAQFEKLSQNFKTIRFDFAGYGKSGVHEHDFNLVDDLKELLTFLEVKSTYLLGLSVGGNVSMDFTLAHPEMVDKLIVASTSLMGWTNFSAERQEYNREINELHQSGNLDEVIALMNRAWVAGPFRSINEVNSEIVDTYSNMIRTSFSKENGKGKMIFPQVKTIESVGEISVPTLIISPDIDFPEFKEIASFLNTRIVDSKMMIISGTAHMLNMEKSAEFNELVLDYLLSQ
jgi:3-oxoadipate enol-lactonase